MRVFAVLAAAAVGSSVASAQTADFRVLAQFSFCTAMSGDGRVVVGVNGSGAQVMWPVDGPVAEVPLNVPAFVEPRGASFDGSVVCGSDAQIGGVPNIQAYRMVNNNSPLGLGAFVPPLATSVENILSEAFGISDDGSSVVGGARTDSAPPFPDGRRPLEAYRWKNGVMMKLGDLPGGVFASVARAANPDGSVVVGEGTTATGAQAWVWRDPAGGGTGMLEPLPDLPGGDDFSQAFDVSDDGSVVVGRSGNAASGPGTSVRSSDGDRRPARFGYGVDRPGRVG
jgi:probable HAF family extracellular repeat protein